MHALVGLVPIVVLFVWPHQPLLNDCKSPASRLRPLLPAPAIAHITVSFVGSPWLLVSLVWVNHLRLPVPMPRQCHCPACSTTVFSCFISQTSLRLRGDSRWYRLCNLSHGLGRPSDDEDLVRKAEKRWDIYCIGWGEKGGRAQSLPNPLG